MKIYKHPEKNVYLMETDMAHHLVFRFKDSVSALCGTMKMGRDPNRWCQDRIEDDNTIDMLKHAFPLIEEVESEDMGAEAERISQTPIDIARERVKNEN